MVRSLVLARLRPLSRMTVATPISHLAFSTEVKDSSKVVISQSKAETPAADSIKSKLTDDKILTSACGDVDDDDDDDDMEEMFVDAHESFEYKVQEWGGPRRGGRLPEPTRFGDWERKGRCSDF